MSETRLPTPEEIRAAYREGEEAVVSLFMELVAEIQGLKARLNKDSHNSSKPPMSDGLKRLPKHSLRHKSGKKSGGQEGHEGHRLEPVGEPKRVVVHAVTRCRGCQA